MIVVLHGAGGGGLELAAAAHIRVAERCAYYALPEGMHGIFVVGSGSVRIPRLIGTARMMDMMLTGRTNGADEGAPLGFSQYEEQSAISTRKKMMTAKPDCKIIRPAATYDGKQGFSYFEGIAAETAGSTGVCMHLLTIPPGGKAKAHKHENHETAIYVISGESHTWYGDPLQKHVIVPHGRVLLHPRWNAASPRQPRRPTLCGRHRPHRPERTGKRRPAA